VKYPRVAILGAGLWVKGFPSAQAWLAGTADPLAEKPLGQALDKVNRRRAGPLGRALADVSAEAIKMAGVDASTVATIIGSAIGEAATMIGLLDQMWRMHEPMSPAEFTVSVHNAASGLISIANKNRGMTTSLAADANTPAAALLEGTGMVLARGLPVLVACGDEPAPDNLAGHAPPWRMLASAVVLAPAGTSPRLADLAVVHGEAPTLRCERFDPLVVANPQIGLAWLVDAVLRRADGRVALDTSFDGGEGRGYLAEITSPSA
jgi:hypothetical protein